VKKIIIFVFTLLSLLSCNGNRTDSSISKRPNILLILADDLGYSDLSCYGSEIQTPHIDALAGNGIRCTRYYTSPMCLTTRVALLSGMEYKAAGGESLPNGLSFVRLLRDAGYATSMVGKNHGFGNFRIGAEETDYGFDHFFGFTGGEINCFTGEGAFPKPEWQSDGRIFPASELDPGVYTTEDFTDSALVFMKEAIENEEPFFSYVAYNAPHTPLHAPERNVRKYYDPANGINVYAPGWEKLREERLLRMKKMGLVSQDTELSDPGVEIPDWDLLPDTAYTQWEIQKKFECLTRSAYAGMVDNIDENVGQMVAFLQDPNGDGSTEDSQLDNTLIIFISDNGGCYAGLHSRREDVPWDRNTSAFTTNFGWGTLSNTPFRYYKHASHEGALRVPLVMHWPEGISHPGGSILHQMLRVWDLYPTFLEMAGVSYPGTDDERPLKPLMGTSFAPLFGDVDMETEEYFVPMFNRTRGMLKDHWKLANFYDGPFELYKLEDDPTERHNLATEEPEKYQEMIELVHQYAVDHGFSGDPSWDRPVGTTKRGWASDFWKGILHTTIPDIASEEVPLDVKLSLEFVGEIDFRETEGKEIRLQKYGDSRILWSSDPDQRHPGQGKTTLVFEDFPTLESGEHYYLTWDAGWVYYKDHGRLQSIRPCLESAFAFRFKTVTE
jgi:arylsulfatase A-like enzyme